MPMRETSEKPTVSATQRRLAIALLAVFGFLMVPAGFYLAGASLIALHNAQPLSDVMCFDPDVTPSASVGRRVAAVAMIVAAVGFLFVSPGLLVMLAFRRLNSKRATAHVWSLIVNSAAMFVAMLVLRNTVGISRLSLTGAWWLWTAVLFLAAWEPRTSPAVLNGLCRRWSLTAATGLGFVLAGVLVLFPEQALQCMNEDGTEAYELARSLRTNALPTWELETWELGIPSRIGTAVVNPSLVNSYWTCGLMALLGDSEIAVRLPFWVWWAAIFVVCCHLIMSTQFNDEPRQSDAWRVSLPVGLLMLLVAVLFTFYVGYNPYMADLASPGVPNALFTLSLLCAFDCLRQRDRAGFTLVMVLASLVLYAGPVMLVLTLAAAWIFQPIPRREVRRWGLMALGILLVLAAAYVIVGVHEGVFSAWIDMLDVEYVSDYLAPVSRVSSGFLFAGYFALACGGICVFGLIAGLRGDAWQRTVATATFGYLLIVLCSGYKNLHYLGPMLPIPLVLLLSAGSDEWRRKMCIVATCSLIACLFLSWPALRQTFVLNRDLGRLTTFTTDSYLDAVEWGRLRFRLRELSVLSWDCDQHTWVAYSELKTAPRDPRPLLVTATTPAFDDYQLLTTRPVEGTRVVAGIFVRDAEVIRWMSSQQPLRPLQRYPWVFKLLASGPYAPHDNQLEEVRRLRDWW